MIHFDRIPLLSSPVTPGQRHCSTCAPHKLLLTVTMVLLSGLDYPLDQSRPWPRLECKPNRGSKVTGKTKLENNLAIKNFSFKITKPICVHAGMRPKSFCFPWLVEWLGRTSSKLRVTEWMNFEKYHHPLPLLVTGYVDISKLNRYEL